MGKQEGPLLLFLLVVSCTVFTGSADVSSPRRDVNQADARRARSRCVSCSVNGQLYDGHSRFQYEEGCNRFRCVCRCDGSWECPAKYTQNICENSGTNQEERHSESGTSSSSSSSSSASTAQRSDSRCMTCVVNGKEHPGHSYFTHVEGCLTFDSCICYCNGSWVCPQDRARSTCDGSVSSGEASGTATWNVEMKNNHSSSNSGSSSGSSFTSSERSSSSSSRSSNSSSSSSSTGSSGGSSVSDSSSTNTQDSRKTDAHRGCVNCTALGKIVAGNSYFDLQDGCRKMKYCTCYCNGSWNCPDRFVENTCGPDNVAAAQESATSTSCRSCSVKGRTFEANHQFQITDGCVEYSNCTCNCDGSWDCPDSGARNICNQGSTFNVDSRSNSVCRQCEAKGQVFPGNQYFQLNDGCIEYKNCICRCDGSWSCPDTGARNVCQERSEAAAGTGSCRTCEVYGSSFPGNQYFQVKQGCVEYTNCICYCNGTWQCPSDSAVNACDNTAASSSSSSASSSVSSASHSSDSSSSSSAERDASTFNVDSRSNSVCRQCEAKGQVFPGNQYFQLNDGCIEYRNCICRCDGSWSCPDTGARNVCQERSEAAAGTGSCRTCEVYGSSFPGNQYFQVKQGCVEYTNCICYCNGTWQCPSDSAVNACDNTAASSSSSSASSSVSSASHSSDSSSSSSAERDASTFNVDSRSNSVCRQCEAKGQVFPGNQYFQLNDGCIEYRNCICRCDGSWSCPDTGARNVCQERSEAAASTGSCKTCEVYGSSFPGNQYFQVKQGCVEYTNCICYCNGTWQCPSHSAVNACDDTAASSSSSSASSSDSLSASSSVSSASNSSTSSSSSSAERDASTFNVDSRSNSVCRQCEAKGQVFPGNQYFQLNDGCIEYRNCICRCDGSWSCPDTGARNVCQERSEAAAGTGSCRTCEVYGSSFPGNQYFQVKQGCVEYTNCICYCNGTWQCPSDSAVNVCDDAAASSSSSSASLSASSSLSSASNSSASSSSSSAERDASRTSVLQCASCLAYGQTFKGGDYFDVIDGCTSYRNCICRCDATWDCNGRFATTVCSNDTRRATETRDSSFDRTDIRNTSRSTSASSSADGRCAFCNAKNKVVKGNTYFELMEGCIEYKNCVCRCDGSWECPSQYAKNVCVERHKTSASTGTAPTTCSTCTAKGKIVLGNTYFELIDGCTRYTSCRCNCDGSWNCPEQRAQNICFTNTTISDHGCSLCQSSDGTVHQPNSHFKLVENCIEYNCDCFCNGSWSCPGKRSRWVCQDKCLQCDVDGRKIQNNTQFVHKTGCLEYTCDCHCNGSWSCPGSTVRNTCPAGVRDGCNKCRVSASEVYEGESDFVLRQDCLQYKCRCNCDGSYSCPGKDARNVCRGEVIGGCRSCAVSETEIYKGETDFTMRKDCIHYECRCNCDGGWECPSEKARNVCLGEVPGGCRACRVSETETYRANSVFDIRKDCINYKCKCNCDGSWSCPGEDARDVCKGETPGGCKSCILSDNEFYPGNSNFEMVKNCIHYKCRCNCDGGYSCPGKTARRVCQSGAVTEAPTCRVCKISEREQFSGNTTFSLERGCARYECECRCDGSWQCPPGKTRDICARGATRPPTTPAKCNPCKISKDVYPGNSFFKFTRGCSQFDCKCECSGRWSCDHKNRVNICRGSNRAATEQSLVSDASAVSRRQDIVASASTQSAGQSSQRGNTFVETDIQSQDAHNTQDQYSSRTNSRSHTAVSSSGSSSADSNCVPCNADGRVIQPNGVFSLDRGCLQYRNCKCYCDGRWQCTEESNRCEATQPPVVPHGERSYRTDTQSTSSRRRDSSSVDSSAWVYVDGVDTSYKTGTDEKTGGGYAVQVDTRYSPTYSTRGYGRQHLEQLEERPHSSRSFTSSGSSSSSSTFITSGSSPDTSSSTSHDARGASQCQQCQVDSKTYRSGANFDMRRGCVIYKCLCLCSGSYRCRLTSDNECSTKDKQNTCSNCLYQGMVFPGSMGFTVREGCEEKQCNCNCDGTHICHTSTPVPGCTDSSSYSASFPSHANFYPVPGGVLPVSTGYITNTGRVVYQSTCTTCVDSGSGPAVYNTPVHPAFGDGGGGIIRTEHRYNVDSSPRDTCPGCFVDGHKQNGNSTFAFKKECIEFDCFCACGGAWKCSGRLAVDCTPGFAPGTVPHAPGCRSCIVQGTSYPANARFSLRQGCHEYQCSCNCDGGWSCPAQHPVNLCPPTPNRPVRGNVMDPQIMREERYVADQGANSQHATFGELNQAAHLSNSSGLKSAVKMCYDCEVRGVTYPASSKFFLRDGCIQRICDCHCNKSWSCSEKTVDICKLAAPQESVGNSGQCRECRVGSEVYISENDFQMNDACYQHNCYCYCNGTHDCPRERVRNICSSDSSASRGEHLDNNRQAPARTDQSGQTTHRRAVASGIVPGCKACYIDGQKIEPLANFVKELGCYESLCSCQCNGQPVCPPGASVNTCELQDKLPKNQRPGCNVGRRTHFTRAFAHVENCIQRTCICHDNGQWSCKRSANDPKVC